MRISPLLLLLPLALVASGTDSAVHRLTHIDEFDQAPSNDVDILWVTDNSISMENEQNNVAAGAQDFVANIQTSGMDLHLGVISTDVDQGNPNAGILLGNPPYLTNSCLLD